MSQRTWTLRRTEDSAGCVLVVTPRLADLGVLAAALAEAGYFAFSSVGAGVESLCQTAAFDLIVVLAGVEATDRDVLRRMQPAERLAELDSDDVPALLACAAARLRAN